MDFEELAFTKETLARVDERTKTIQNEMIQMRADFKSAIQLFDVSLKESEARQVARVVELEKSLLSVIDSLDKNYVKKEAFAPIQKLVLLS